MGFRRLAFIAIFLGNSLIAWSQPTQPQDPSGDPDAVPITGLEYLLIGGGAYGVSRLLKHKKNKSA